MRQMVCVTVFGSYSLRSTHPCVGRQEPFRDPKRVHRMQAGSPARGVPGICRFSKPFRGSPLACAPVHPDRGCAWSSKRSKSSVCVHPSVGTLRTHHHHRGKAPSAIHKVSEVSTIPRLCTPVHPSFGTIWTPCVPPCASLNGSWRPTQGCVLLRL